MRITINVECPTWMKKVSRIGLPVLAIGAAGVAFGGPLATWNAGDTLKAADLNGNFKQLDTRTSALESTAPQAWQSYPVAVVVRESPSTPMTGVSKKAGFYRRVGDTIEVRIYTEFSAAPSGGNYLAWTLPSGLHIDGTKLAGGSLGYAYRDALGVAFASAGTSNYSGVVGPAPNDVVCVAVGSNNDLGPANGAPSLGSGDTVELSFSVPVTP